MDEQLLSVPHVQARASIPRQFPALLPGGLHFRPDILRVLHAPVRSRPAEHDLRHTLLHTRVRGSPVHNPGLAGAGCRPVLLRLPTRVSVLRDKRVDRDHHRLFWLVS